MSRPVNILVLDDEVNILTSLKRSLLKEPYDIVTTTKASEAMEILANGKIKVVISDQRMPEVSGVQFLKDVKEKYPDVIRILLTGHADMHAAEEAVNVGQVYRFLTKPWKHTELAIDLRAAIEVYDLTVENRRLFEETRSANDQLLKVNDDLQKLYEKQKEFTSTVSHELRTPLASIKMALDIIISGSSGPLTEDQSNFLGKAKANVDRLNRLINDILDLSKLESGKIEMRIEPGDLAATIRESLEPQMSIAESKGVSLRCEAPDDVPQVCFDKDRITQVLYNLVGNALKFTDAGEVLVKASFDLDMNLATVAVEDTGPGVREEDLPNLFQKFQQLEENDKKIRGTGLGLVICKTIVERHAGKIWAESTFGQGSRFCFLIPIVDRRKV